MEFTVINVLGERRAIDKLYEWTAENGQEHFAYNCPFCASAVTTERNQVACENPWCPANPAMSIDAACRQEAKRWQSAKDEYDRKRNHEWAMQRIKEENEARIRAYQDWTMKVRAANGCLACSNQYHGKIRKHRLECPKIRQVA